MSWSLTRGPRTFSEKAFYISSDHWITHMTSDIYGVTSPYFMRIGKKSEFGTPSKGTSSSFKMSCYGLKEDIFRINLMCMTLATLGLSP